MSTWVGRPTGVAHCAFGHTWPVTLTWSPVVLGGTPVPNTWTFEAAPRWCEACFLSQRLASVYDGVVCDASEPSEPAAIAAAGPGPVTVEEGASHVTDPR